MENAEQNTEETVLEITEKIPNKLLSEQLEIYGKAANMEGYAQIGLIVFPVLFLLHNIFIAGNSYEYDTYKTIKTTELAIVLIIGFVILIFVVISMILNSKLKNNLLEAAKRYSIKREKMEEEFSALSIHIYGGRGVKFKKK